MARPAFGGFERKEDDAPCICWLRACNAEIVATREIGPGLHRDRMRCGITACGREWTRIEAA
jgi:hypothetical protein